MDKKEVIRKLISEEVAKILDEDYESVQEIKSLAEDILMYFSKQNYSRIKEYSEDLSKIVYFNPIKINAAYQNSSKKYKNLEDFLIETNIMFLFLPSDGSDYGHYSAIISKNYNPGEHRDISLFYKNDFIEKLQEQISEKNSNSKEISVTDIYTIMYLFFLSTLVHELQHAYDDYRSKGKLYNTKEFNQYIEDYEDEVSLVEKNDDLNMIKRYFNLPHEVWARFSQAVLKLEFYNSAGLFESPGGKLYLKYKIRPLRAVVNEFFYKYDGWQFLFEPENNLSNIQRRLIKAIVSFWNKEYERVVEKNKNPQYFN